jgi:hypothetical protein
VTTTTKRPAAQVAASRAAALKAENAAKREQPLAAPEAAPVGTRERAPFTRRLSAAHQSQGRRGCSARAISAPSPT